MALKPKRNEGILQIYGVAIGNLQHCDYTIKDRIKTYIETYNEKFSKKRQLKKYGIKGYYITHYQFSLSDEKSNSYMLSYIVNFYR